MERHDPEKKQVVVSADDIKNIEDFFIHFKIPMPAPLESSVLKYKDNPVEFTFEDQCKLRAYIAYAVTTVDHPLLKDQVFSTIREKCSKAYYDARFDLDLEEVLAESVKA